MTMVLCCAALLVAGCGGQDWSKAGGRSGSAGGSAVLLRALDTTAAAHTAKIAMTMELKGFSVVSVTITGRGVVDFQKGDAELSMHVVSSIASADGNDLEARVVGGSVYTRSGGGWTKSNLASGVGAASNPDPTNYLAYLRGVADNVQAAGHETLRGVDTTKYTGTLDLQQAIAKEKDGPQKQSVQRLLDVVGDLQMPFTVWIDGDGHLRKFQMSMDFSSVATKLGLSGASSPMAVVTMEMYDFGTPVNVQAPAGATPLPSATGRAQDRATQSDLRNALTAEKTVYVDNSAYDASPANMKQVEPSLDWGGRLHVHVGSAVTPGDRGTVCLGEVSASGINFVLADVTAGPYAGTYYGTNTHCPSGATPQALSKLGTSW